MYHMCTFYINWPLDIHLHVQYMLRYHIISLTIDTSNCNRKSQYTLNMLKDSITDAVDM